MMLEVLVERIVNRVKGGEDPNKAVKQVFQDTPNLTTEHKKRLIEMANVKLFNINFQNGEHEFELIDPKKVLGEEEKGVEKAASEEDFTVSFEEEHFRPIEKVAADGGSSVEKAPRWWHDAKFLSDIPNSDELVKLAATAKIRNLLKGKDYKIPTIEKIAHLLDKNEIVNLYFKRESGFEESDELAEEILKTAERYL